MPGLGREHMRLAWSGLLYAFVNARQVSVDPGQAGSGLASEGARRHLLEVGARLWRGWPTSMLPSP